MKRAIGFLALAVLCAGCRSDGGIDRKDCGTGMEFSTSTVANQFKRDCSITSERITTFPETLRKSIAESWRNLSNSYHLYLDNHEPR